MRKIKLETLMVVTCMVGSACVTHTIAEDEAREATVTQASGLTRYTVNPSATDLGLACVNNAHDDAIGCDSENQWGLWANNDPHVLFPSPLQPFGVENRLLVFLPGRNGEANDPDLVSLFETAALQGYHVIALTYPNQGEDRMRDPGNLSHYCGAPDHCFGQFMQEVIDGTQCPPALCNDDDGHDDLRFETGRHPQDTIVRRLEAALTWAVVMHPFDGWAQFRNTSGSVRWGRVTVAGHSLGSSYAAMLGVQFPVHRVALFSGPDDQINGDPDPWIQPTSKEDRFFGLAHISDDSVETSEAWTTFGMDGFSYLYPPPNTVTNFGNAQMLISMDIGDNHPHTAVVKTPFSGNTRIDYRPAWRHLFGSGYIGF